MSVDQTVAAVEDLVITDNQPKDQSFQKLGSVTIADGTIDVVLGFGDSSAADTFIIADAVAIVKQIPKP